MQIKRLFSTASARGGKNYINSQKKYEILRTLLYFGISISLFAAGYIQTKSTMNLLTIVAVLGCLPASKSAVSAIMFLRFRSCKESVIEAAQAHSQGLYCLYDMVFTSYKRNYIVGHLAVRGYTVCGFSEEEKFPEEEFRKHIGNYLKLDGHMDVTVKIFTNLDKYTERLEQMKALEPEEARTEAVAATLKSVAL